MITVRHAADRGRANFGWLDSKHTFLLVATTILNIWAFLS